MQRSLALCWLVLASAAAPAQTEPGSAALAIAHVTVIDATRAAARSDQTVVIKNGRIIALGRSAEVPTPRAGETVDFAGKFLIPGLCDMHAHIAAGGRDSLSLYLANGVTGVRDMPAYSPDLIFSLRKDVEAGKLTGPRIV